ncbi:hypothetical protein ACFXG4_04200 [Nocardia sp. NPDC059246]|uniref:hypothetical protein n=1 Tax=unclassified Nocardia TaxID=2637762 RepID=UPI0036988043
MSQRKTPLDDGAWVAYPIAGERPGEGGDAYAVRFFGNNELSELQALHYSNDNPGYKAVYMAVGESILEAEKHRD